MALDGLVRLLRPFVTTARDTYRPVTSAFWPRDIVGRPLFSERRVQSLNRSMLGRDRLAYRESGRSRALNQALNATLGEQLLAHNRAPASHFPQTATGPGGQCVRLSV